MGATHPTAQILSSFGTRTRTATVPSAAGDLSYLVPLDSLRAFAVFLVFLSHWWPASSWLNYPPKWNDRRHAVLRIERLSDHADPPRE
jgi:hypothetical protein